MEQLRVQVLFLLLSSIFINNLRHGSRFSSWFWWLRARYGPGMGQVWARDVGILPVPADALKSFSSDREGCFFFRDLKYQAPQMMIRSGPPDPPAPWNAQAGVLLVPLCEAAEKDGPHRCHHQHPAESWAAARDWPLTLVICYTAIIYIYIYICIYIYMYVHIYICIYICNTGYMKHWTVELGDHLERTTRTNQPGCMNPGLKQTIFAILHGELRS